MAQVSVVFSHRFPGRYAMNVLAGAVESAPELSDVELRFPRDFAALEAATREELARDRTVIVAWSFYSPSFPDCASELERLRKVAKFTGIAGGVHATAEPLETLQAGFDLICIGEGERALIELLRLAKAGAPLTATPGFARLEDGAVVRSSRPERIELDDYPPFGARSVRFGAIELTRGCIYACRFCQTPFFSKAAFRHRSPANVETWARVLRSSGRPDLRFISPTALSYGSEDESVNLAAIAELLSRTRSAMGDGKVFFGTFPSEVRPEHVTPEALRLLKKYVDNDNLIIGGQSGADRVLESSRRGHDAAAIERAVHLSLEGGFLPNVDFILGLPGETADDVRATIELMKRLGALGAKVHGHSFMPLPGTPFRDAPPATLEPWMVVELERLASQQQLYGQWKRQAEVARQLAGRRDARRREA